MIGGARSLGTPVDTRSVACWVYCEWSRPTAVDANGVDLPGVEVEDPLGNDRHVEIHSTGNVGIHEPGGPFVGSI